ncbi:MAG: signal peptidase II [Chromatiales bacterium]|jgi:signal peptidase II
MLRWLLLSLLVIALDQASKIWVENSFELYERLPLTGFFNLTLVYNQGAAFSFLADAGGWQRWFFTILAVVISAVLIGWLRRLQSHETLLAVSLALLIGGALGNLIDRIAYGHVIDFLDVYYQQWHWPAFNLADSAITLGVILFIWDALFNQSSKDSIN